MSEGEPGPEALAGPLRLARSSGKTCRQCRCTEPGLLRLRLAPEFTQRRRLSDVGSGGIRTLGSRSTGHPSEVIEHAVWLCHYVRLSLRNVGTTLANYGVVVSHSIICDWVLRFVRLLANAGRRRRPKSGEDWHLAAMILCIGSGQRCLWRVVDQQGHVQDLKDQSHPISRPGFGQTWMHPCRSLPGHSGTFIATMTGHLDASM